MLKSLLFAVCVPLASGWLVHAHSPTRRAGDVRMGGPSGLPRMPIKAWPLTKRFNPSGQYNERIATLWRDLEITFGMDEELTFRALKRCPDLVNPQESSRWVFFRSKDLLVKQLGSERAAITAMSKDPELLLCPSYDGLNPKLEQMLGLTAADVRAAGPSGLGIPPAVLLAGVAIAAAAAVYANGLIAQ